MKLKLITIAAVFAAGALGFWVGFYRGRVLREGKERSFELAYNNARHFTSWTRVQLSTHVLKNLAEGKLDDARRALEEQLDLAIIGTVAYEKTFLPDGVRDGLDLQLIREARDYRLRNPWKSDRKYAEALHEAFKWAD